MEYIYIITSPENEHFQKFKIGRTSNPEKKDLLRRYHTSLPEVKILEFIPVFHSKIVEESIHKLLDKYRISGSEWFQGDLFLFQQTVYTECFRDKQENIQTRSEIIDKMFQWFQNYYDPHLTFDILEYDESRMKINIGSERFLCPISNHVHTENRFHVLKMNFHGDLFFSCSVCSQKKKLGNIGVRPVFHQAEEEFKPSEIIIRVSKQLKLLDSLEQKLGYMHIKTNKIYDVEDDIVYEKDNIVFHIEDDMKKRMEWLDFQKRNELFMFECVKCQDKVELNCLSGECFSYNECVKFEYKEQKLICLDCGHVQDFKREFDLLPYVEEFMKKYNTKFKQKRNEQFVFESCDCPIHKENHELVVEVTKDGSVELKCLAQNKIMNFVYSKIGELDFCFTNQWINIFEGYTTKEDYNRYVSFLKKNTKRKPISQLEFLKKINMAIK